MPGSEVLRLPLRIACVALPTLLISAAVTGCYPKGWSERTQALTHLKGFLFETGPYLVLMGPGRVAVVVSHDADDPPLVRWW